MADFRIDSRMKVKTLKANFKKEFGATLRVYTTENCKAMADDEATNRISHDLLRKGWCADRRWQPKSR